MRSTITISVSPEMEDYIREACGELTVSEYIRSLVRREQKRREDYRAKPAPPLAMNVNDGLAFHQALKHLEMAKEILQRRDEYDLEYDE